MTSNPLGPANLLKGMADALPAHEKGDSTSDVSAPLDAVSLFTHACMASVSFRLLGFDEDQKIGASSRLAPTSVVGTSALM